METSVKNALAAQGAEPHPGDTVRVPVPASDGDFAVARDSRPHEFADEPAFHFESVLRTQLHADGLRRRFGHEVGQQARGCFSAEKDPRAGTGGE